MTNNMSKDEQTKKMKFEKMKLRKDLGIFFRGKELISFLVLLK